MENKKFSCIGIKVLGLIAIITHIVISIFFIQPDTAVLVRTTVELVIVIFAIQHFYCKKNNKE